MIKWAEYRKEYGNVFDWIIRATEERRDMKYIEAERFRELYAKEPIVLKNGKAK